MLFQEGELLVRKADPADARLLWKWLSDPAVLEFYEGRDRRTDAEAIEAKYLAKQGSPGMGCIVEWRGEAIGYAQFYPLDAALQGRYGFPATERVYGMDQFIGEPEHWNRGIGTRLVKAMAQYLCESKKADWVAMDPQVQNGRAIRCYEKAGFRKVRPLPQWEMHEGRMRDCWLMEYRGSHLNPHTVQIRRFRPPDQEHAQALILQGLQDHWGMLDPTRNPDLGDIGSAYPGSFFMIAEIGGRLVATGALVSRSSAEAEIVRMSVARDLRGRGIGSLMLRRLLAEARAGGFRRVILETTATWHEVVAFYLKSGFRVTRYVGEDVYLALDLDSGQLGFHR